MSPRRLQPLHRLPHMLPLAENPVPGYSPCGPRCPLAPYSAVMTLEPITSPSTQDAAELLARLGGVLVDGGAIDRRSLDRARRVAIETGTRLDQVLTQLGLISDRGLAEAMAQLIAAPLVSAADYPEAPLFPDRLKPKFLRRARVLPIATSEERATLAMADPLDIFARNAVAAALGRPVVVAVA